jgi:hypothetical protein
MHMISIWKDFQGDWHIEGQATGYLLYGVMYTEPQADIKAALAFVKRHVRREIHWVGINQTGCRPGIAVDIELWTPMVHHRKKFSTLTVVPMQLEARKNERALPEDAKEFLKRHIINKKARRESLRKQFPDKGHLLMGFKALLIIDFGIDGAILYYDNYAFQCLTPGMQMVALLIARKSVSRADIMHNLNITNTSRSPFELLQKMGVIETERRGWESIYHWRGYDDEVRRRLLET